MVRRVLVGSGNANSIKGGKVNYTGRKLWHSFFRECNITFYFPFFIYIYIYIVIYTRTHPYFHIYIYMCKSIFSNTVGYAIFTVYNPSEREND